MTYKTQSEALRPAVQLADTVGARLPSWQDMLGDAERFVRQKPTFSKYIRGTVLENDVPVWIADFAQRLLLRELTLLALRVRAAALEEAIKIIEEYRIPVGNSAAGELACEWTRDALEEIRDVLRAMKGEQA
jgi:hypothetical protein